MTYLTVKSCIASLAVSIGCSLANAEVPALYAGADLTQGSQLMGQHKCSACHQRNVGGDGNDIYNPKGRINTLGLLRGMVEACNTQLNLGLFPEEVNSIAAVLNRDHYKLKQ